MLAPSHTNRVFPSFLFRFMCHAIFLRWICQCKGANGIIKTNSNDFQSIHTAQATHARHWVMMRHKNRCVWLHSIAKHKIFFVFNIFWQIIWLMLLLSVVCVGFCVCAISTGSHCDWVLLYARHHCRIDAMKFDKTQIVPHTQTHTNAHSPPTDNARETQTQIQRARKKCSVCLQNVWRHIYYYTLGIRCRCCCLLCFFRLLA